MDLIWLSEKIIKFGEDLIWRSEKKIKFGADLIWRFLPFCANCAKFLRAKIYRDKILSDFNILNRLTLF